MSASGLKIRLGLPLFIAGSLDNNWSDGVCQKRK